MSFVPEVRCAIYERISRDRAGDQLGITRQRQDCERLATSRGWVVVGHYVDNDVSAYDGRERPAWDRLVEDLGASRVDAIIAWHPDRTYRRMRDLEDLVDLVESRRVAMATVQAGDVDLSTTQGRLVARLAGAVAAHESEHKSERIIRKHLELAERGRWKGGRRNYGYRPVGGGQLEVVPEEAKVIREAAERALAGEAIHGICMDFTARGIPTLRGGRLASHQPATNPQFTCSLWSAGVPRQGNRTCRLGADPGRGDGGPSSRPVGPAPPSSRQSVLVGRAAAMRALRDGLAVDEAGVRSSHLRLSPGGREQRLRTHSGAGCAG